MEYSDIEKSIQKMFLRCNNAKSVEDALATCGGEIIVSGNYSEVLIPQELAEINNIIKIIYKSYRLFLQGQIEDCYNSIYHLLFESKFAHPAFNIKILDDSKWWYRMRKNDSGYTFTKEELFHVPFHERWKIANYRYSLSGFPCLYLGSSIYDCWEELNRPDFYYANVSGYKLRRNVNVIDLRFPQQLVSAKDYYLLPLIIACSVRVNNENTNFKPEYIISQAVLHAIIKHSNCKNVKPSINGILAYSSKCGNISNLFESKDLFENLILPTVTNTTDPSAEKICDKDYCPILTNTLSLTSPTSYYLYDLAQLHYLTDVSNKKKDYESTKFAKFEHYIQQMKLLSLDHCSFFKINKELQCKY